MLRLIGSRVLGVGLLLLVVVGTLVLLVPLAAVTARRHW